MTRADLIEPDLFEALIRAVYDRDSEQVRLWFEEHVPGPAAAFQAIVTLGRRRDGRAGR